MKKIFLTVIAFMMFAGIANAIIAQLPSIHTVTHAPDATESNNVPNSVNSIYLKVSGASLTWIVDGYSKKGYKVVWSKTTYPTYPTRKGDKYHYISNPDKKYDTITKFDGSGVYYARVCEYLGGKCGKYSNQVKVAFGSDYTEIKVEPKTYTNTDTEISKLREEVKELRKEIISIKSFIRKLLNYLFSK